ncbi:hypothetical protein Z947_3242 [Sulfitobacter geojensis]|nr:hypothetical protein Z947_3242 [Sulfitobacter geojensis]
MGGRCRAVLYGRNRPVATVKPFHCFALGENRPVMRELL